jgi:hypothetical protein
MNVVLLYNHFNDVHVYFDEPIQNIIMNNSKFTKITYSNEHVMLSGIYLSLPIKYTKIEDHYKKMKITYDIKSNKELLQGIYDIESTVLNKYSNNYKTQKKVIYDTLKTGTIKFFPTETNNSLNNKNFILKISGIWENETEYGVTYKIM